MNKRPLEELFFATFREKQTFSEFLKLDMESEYSRGDYDGRSIYSPNKNLKLYLSFLSRVLFDRLPVAKEVVFSYRKGVNVVDAVEKHGDNKYFFQSDIKNFFFFFSRDIIGKAILSSLEVCPVADIDCWLDRILDMVTVDGFLPPGFPTSPAISNACLYKFDKRFLTWCNGNGLVYTRYADDLIVSSMEGDSMRLLIPHIDNLLAEEFGGVIKLNVQKTKFMRPGEKVKILGVAILPNGKVSVDGRIKKDSETAMYWLLKDKESFISFLKEADMDKALKKFSGRLNYINTVDPSYLDKLRKKYGSTVVDKVMHLSVAL